MLQVRAIDRVRAFTLIELLIVVAIIAILALIAVPNFLEAQTRAKVSRVRSDHRSLGMALEAYALDWNCYPWYEPLIDNPQNLARLSTPVAYMANPLLKDPFKKYSPGTNIRPSGVGNLFLNYIFVPFQMQDGSWPGGDVDRNFWDVARARSHGAGPGVPFPLVLGHDLGGVNGDPTKFPGPFHWVLASYGPDPSLQFDDPNPGNPYGYDAYLPYDPTNGTVSWGDIFRFGGE